MNGNATSPSTTSGGFQRQVVGFQRRFQKFLDHSTPHVAQRWIGTGLISVLYAVRVLTIHGWYIVTYALGIYLLNLFLAFLSPKIDPAFEFDSAEEGDGGGPSLPTKADEEFRPFIRRLPEFKFWLSSTRAIIIAFFCTFFTVFDVPVFWPILVLYFLILFSITMRRQIRHMIKYRYLPFDFGKKTYGTSRGVPGVGNGLAPGSVLGAQGKGKRSN
ncbi:retrieval of early ER protein Rer1 [Gonapodya prolifera JEL478]|uniref:Protein RER1 n=1 Tax=Gonapodya prolifera (strain JEL478) TaxID=1344416 RepID=A0A139AWP4_GONPJ|nr:retrieval of early ER protein Rer1 [Gonapodya prolifera JEL478]|eukprot:KXS20895.1 retrieval of early ER protein Rer1 [Gonapodya prolifera JEL478]